MIPYGVGVSSSGPCGCHDCSCPGCIVCDGEPDNAGPDYPLPERPTGDPWADYVVADR